MSATWVQALRAYIARTGPPSTAASRHRLYDQIAHAQLAVRHGARLRPESLAVVREARWALLREGTTSEKSNLLEHVLQSLSTASEAVTYHGSLHRSKSGSGGGSSGTQGNSQGRASQDHIKKHSSSSNAEESSSASSAALENLSDRHQLLLEQVQCLVEAKVSDIPLTARHYRYPLRSPLLAEVSPELPLLLLEELARAPPQPSSLSKSRTEDGGSSCSGATSGVDWAAQADCCASLAAAGHVREALALCGEDGRMFRAAVQRVAQQRRDGWRQAWALAEAVPPERVIGVARPPNASAEAAAAYSEDWLRGVLEAVQLRHRASPPPRDADAPATHRESEELFVWVDQLRQLLLATPAKAKTSVAGESSALPDGGGGGGDDCRASHALRKARRLVLDAYLAICPPRRWRDAVGTVLAIKAAQHRPAPAAEVAEDENAEEGDGVSMGRVMALLQYAQQPWVTLLFFYGDPLSFAPPQRSSALAASSSSSQSDASANVWTVEMEEVQRVVEELVNTTRSSDRLAVATGALMSERDVRHAAVYNHAMAALGHTGHHGDAIAFYNNLPVARVNAYTHWGVLQLFLQPNVRSTAATALQSPTNYACCLRALKRLVRIHTAATETDASTSAFDGDARETAATFTHDQANVWESMALWAARRGDADTAELCAAHAPASCRYVHVIALIAAANAKEAAAVRRRAEQICKSDRTTRKELCLAAAVIAVYYPTVHAEEAVAAVGGAVYDQLTRALANSARRQQALLDEELQLLIDYVSSLLHRRATPVNAENGSCGDLAALQDLLDKTKVLHCTMDLVRLGSSSADAGDEVRQARTTAVWRTVAQLIRAVGDRQNLSVARAAPALVSAGVDAEVAIDLLPA